MSELVSCGKCTYLSDCKRLFQVTKDTKKECQLFTPKGSKYRNEKVTIDGITFDSTKEAQRYSELQMMLRAGEITKLELQPVFELQPGFVKDGKKYQPIKYIADFRITYKDGHIEVEDTKGFRTKDFELKRKMFEFRYPDLTLKLS